MDKASLKILGLDIETTGLDHSEDEIIELGLVVYDVDRQQTVSSASFFFETNKWDDELEDIYSFPREYSKNGIPLKSDFNPFSIIQHDVYCICSHNADFDKPFVISRWPDFDKISWLCTHRDLDHSSMLRRFSSERVAHLAVDYGIPVYDWHRALSDAELCARIAAKHDVVKAMARKSSQQYMLQVTGYFNTNYQRDLSLAGFRYSPEIKTWEKYDLIQEELDFYVKYVTTCAPGWEYKVVKQDKREY